VNFSLLHTKQFPNMPYMIQVVCSVS